MIAAYGMSGVADKAEATFAAMRAAGWAPRDYAYCGLIAAHSFKGDWQVRGGRARGAGSRRLPAQGARAVCSPRCRPPAAARPQQCPSLARPPPHPCVPHPPTSLQAALRVKERMAAAGAAPTVHVFNALIAACDRAHQYERALRVAREMREAGVPGNGVTQSVRWRAPSCEAGLHCAGPGARPMRCGFVPTAGQPGSAGVRCAARLQRQPNARRRQRVAHSRCLRPAPPPLRPQLLDGVCKEGVRAVESQQAAAAALSAAVAAAGTIMIRAGIF